MSTLVATFQERLEVSKTEASWRVVGFLLCAVCIIATIALTLTYFPYWSGYSDQVAILPGPHTQVSKILDGEVLLERNQFLELIQGQQTFIAPGDARITYMAKVNGISYRYVQKADYDFRYAISSQTIREGIMVREFYRDSLPTVMLFEVLPSIVILVLMLLARKAQGKAEDWNYPLLLQKGVWWRTD